MKKIIFFSKDLNIGGMEKALILLLNQLINQYHVTLVLEKKEGLLLKNLSPKVKIEEYSLSTSKNIAVRKTKNFLHRLIWGIKRKNQYDFSCNYATYSVLGSKLAQIASKNSSLYIHSNYYEMYHHDKEKIYKFFQSHQLDKFRKLIFVSNESKLGLENIYPEYKENMVVINNLFDHQFIKKSAQKKIDFFPLKKEAINFIFVGRLENESKNLKLLLQSFYDVSKVNSNYKLWIVGNGPYRNSMEEFIKQNHLFDTISLLGEQENPYPYLSLSDCLILTSNYEGFPVVYLEALTLNIPIMTTVLVSDDAIDMNQYCICIQKDKKNIVNTILKFQKGKKNYQINFDQLNQERIKKIKKIIEVKI